MPPKKVILENLKFFIFLKEKKPIVLYFLNLKRSLFFLS